MSSSDPMDFDFAYRMATALKDMLEPACERIEIAGSIRRGKIRPGDIEIVCEPSTTTHIVSEIGRVKEREMTENLLDSRCRELLIDGTLEKRPDSMGRHAWGEKAKRGVFFQGMDFAPVDIFSVIDPAQWGIIFAIRTGPGDWNRLLVSDRRIGGACPEDLKISGGQVWYLPENDYQLSLMPSNKFLKVAEANGAKTRPVESEEHFFDILGVPYLDPIERTAARLRQIIKELP